LKLVGRRVRQRRLVLCLRNDGCEDLQVRKLYERLPDADAAKEGYLRVVDESGEDYLYPAEYFVLIPLPPAVVKALIVA
jgi:hypothetical protein